MSNLLIAPILWPLAVGAASFFARRNRVACKTISVSGVFVQLCFAVALLLQVQDNGILAYQAGAWAAPFGITLVADTFSAIMVVVTGIIGLMVTIYAIADIDPSREIFGYDPLFHVMLAGVGGAFLAGDIFNLYVWFELMLIASFGLMVLGGEKAQIDGGIKYASLNLIATLLLLTAIALIYAMTGTLNMADLALAVRNLPDDDRITVVAVLFMVAFGIKAGLFPLFFWLPASYHTPPVAVSAVFAGLLTKVGVYALIRLFSLIFVNQIDYTHGLLMVLAILSMAIGVLTAAGQTEFRRILSFHIISQVGYMVLGLALFTPLGLAGAVFYLVHHIIVKANLFLVSGLTNRLGGSFHLAKLGGMYGRFPWLSALFLIPALSLAGFPPLSGFWAKFTVIKASLDVGEYFAAVTALVVGILTIFSMTKIWHEVFWKPAPVDAPAPIGSITHAFLLGPVMMLSLITLTLGLWPQPIFEVAHQAAHELLHSDLYIEAVLGVDALVSTPAVLPDAMKGGG